jgi:hypothetical protein
MVSRRPQQKKEPNIPPERAVRALSQQLTMLHSLKGRNYREAESKKTEWEHLTQDIIEGAFGNPSSQLSRFYAAKNCGIHQLGGTSPKQMQENYNAEIQEYESLLSPLIEALRLQLPETETRGVYEPGEEYEFYRDLASIIRSATQEIFIVDAYIDGKVFELYVSEVPSSVKIQILSNNVKPNVETIAKMFAQKHPVELRTSSRIHDRHIFIDQRGWIMGQSIKDAASKKPTYLVELEEPSLSATRDIHNTIWNGATLIV